MLRLLALSLLLLEHQPAEARIFQPALTRILDRVSDTMESGIVPVVIADLDETLIDSTPRRYQAYREATHSACGQNRTRACASLTGINISEFQSLANRYDQNPLLDAIGVSPGEFRSRLQKDALDVYFSGKLLDLDQAVPGSVEFIQALKRRGAIIFFVSSRSASKQWNGTVQSLRELGLTEAEDPKNRVILRPDEMNSIEFKRDSFRRIRLWAKQNNGGVKVVMENEPENMNGMTEIFPHASALFVDGAHIKYEPLRGNPLHVKDFR